MGDSEASGLRYDLRQVARTPIDRVEDQALVKVRGVVTIEGPPANAPITGAPCAVYAVEASLLPPRLERDDFGFTILPDDYNGYGFQPPPVPLRPATGGRDFYLVDDGSMRALIRIEHAQLSLLGRTETAYARDHARFLAGRITEPLRDRAELEYRELVVVPGEILTVYGRATSESDSSALPSARRPYRDAPVRKVFAAAPASPLFIIQERLRSLDALD